MVHYEPLLTIITADLQTEVLIEAIIKYHCLSDSIISDWGSQFISKFWLFFLLLSQRQASTQYCFPPTNWYANRETKQYYLSILTMVLLVWARWLGTLAPYGRVSVQQLPASKHYNEIFWAIARLSSVNVLRRQLWPAISISDWRRKCVCITWLDEKIKSEPNIVTRATGTLS